MEKVFAAFLAAACIFYGTSCKQAKDAFIEGALRKEVEKFNKTGGGKMIDRDTRLDSLSVKPGKLLIYHYTAVTYTKSDLDSNALKKFMRPAMKKLIMQNKDLAALRNKDVTFQYIYYDKGGDYWFAITLKPEDYLEKRQK